MKGDSLWYCLLLTLIIGSCSADLLAQSDSTATQKPKNWALNGYLKHLPSVSFVQQPQSSMIQSNLIHNRLNFNWYISSSFTFKAALRTRVFFGEQVKLTPNYADLIQQGSQTANGYTDYLSWILLDTRGAVIHSTLDRLYFNYSKDKWDITIGRQRINWGINTLWNPNDIFNTYSFTDFDYEERPGSDAIRIQYYTGVTSSIEFAVKAFTQWEYATAAFLWKTNKWNYDFQFLGGIVRQDIVLGAGWAGNIGLVGFKGEASYFYNFDTLATTKPHSLTATVGLDYVFPSRTYLTAGFLFNTNGVTNAAVAQLFAIQPTAKNLYPYKYSVSLGISHPFTEKITAGLTTVYSPGESHALFVSPNFSYIIDESWDLSLVGQIVLNAENGYYTSPVQAIFLRFKFSF